MCAFLDHKMKAFLILLITKISQKYIAFQPCHPNNTPKFTEMTPLTCPFQLEVSFKIMSVKKRCSIVNLNIDDDEDLWLFCIMYLHSRVGNCFYFCTLQNKTIKALKFLKSDSGLNESAIYGRPGIRM